LSFFKTGIIVEKYRINFVTFHNGLLGGVNCNTKLYDYQYNIL
ncbi:hypothetical protein C804_06543, partial [Lachnospiraceae bacterium A4]